jgi:hypothetical protein
MEILWKHEEMNTKQLAYILEDEMGWHVNPTDTTIKKWFIF